MRFALGPGFAACGKTRLFVKGHDFKSGPDTNLMAAIPGTNKAEKGNFRRTAFRREN
jgi:hypothetical protein